jgi:hypothetical protein
MNSLSYRTYSNSSFVLSTTTTDHSTLHLVFVMWHQFVVQTMRKVPRSVTHTQRALVCSPRLFIPTKFTASGPSLINIVSVS